MGLDMYLDEITQQEERIYWRKCNAIHRWFVENTQYGRDECQPSVVTPRQLRVLQQICKEVLEVLNSEEPTEKTIMGYRFEFTDDKKIKGIEEPYVVKTYSKEVSAKLDVLLPTQSGFFFGSTEYDSWYKDDIVKTLNELEKIFANYGKDDLDPRIFIYTASW